MRTFQTARALTRMTVLDNVVLGAPRHPGERFAGAYLRRRASAAREAEARERAGELLALVRLDGHARRSRRHALGRASASCSTSPAR